MNGNVLRQIALQLSVAAGVFMLAGAPASAAMSLGPPILHYTFDSADISGTTVTDQGSGGYTGTIVGDPTSTTGRFGQALSFDPTSGAAADFVRTSTPVLTTTGAPGPAFQPYTIAAWVKFTDTNQAGIVGQYTDIPDSWGVLTHRFGNDNLSWYHGGDPIIHNVDLNNGAWRQIVYTRDSAGALKLYIDGVDTVASATDTFDTFNNRPFAVGALDAFGTAPFLGAIDEVYVFDKALTAQQINSSLFLENLPEPTGLALLSIGSVAVLRRRR